MIDLAIVIIYLAATFILGVGQSKRANTVHDFALGNQHCSTATLVATLFATGIGGVSTLGVSERVFSVGIVFLFVFWGEPISNMIAGQFLAPRVQRFKGMISVGDIMGHFYGKTGTLIAGVAATLKCTGCLGGQIGALGYLLHLFFGWSQGISLCIGYSVVIFYCGFGGMRAVTLTDVLQFSILILAIPTLLLVCVQKAGGWVQMFQHVPDTHWMIPPPQTDGSQYMFSFIVLSIPFLTPPFAQRLLMAKDSQQARQSMFLTAAIGFPFFLACALIGLAALSIAPNIDPNLAMPYLAKTVLIPGIRGCALVGLLAIIMSTADSFLHSASIAFVHDVIRPLWPIAMPNRLELRLTRVATFVLGYAAMAFPLWGGSLVDILFLAFHFWGPIIVPPLFAGLLGIQVSTKAFLMAVTAGVCYSVAHDLLLQPLLHVDGLLPATIANALVLWVAYYMGQQTK